MKVKTRLFVLLAVVVVAVLAVMPVFAQETTPGEPPASGVEFAVTPQLLTVLVAGALALIFDYFPHVAKWYDTLVDASKRQLMAGMVIGFALIIFAGQCFGLFGTNLSCSVKGGFDLLYILLLAIGVNQGLHSMTKPTLAMRKEMFDVKK
jgi:hypothetical protein